MNQQEAIDFVREMAKTKTTYRVSKILDVSWPTVRNWLSEKPNEIQLSNLEKIEKLKKEKDANSGI